MPKITVPLPSRKEQCVFTLKPITHTVGNFIHMLKKEDRGIDRAIVTTIGKSLKNFLKMQDHEPLRYGKILYDVPRRRQDRLQQYDRDVNGERLSTDNKRHGVLGTTAVASQAHHGKSVFKTRCC